MRILVIGDPHGNLNKIKKIPVKKADLILLTGDLGSSNLMRKMAFEDIERKKRGLQEKEYSSNTKKRAFMEAYDSTMQIINYLKKFAPVFTIFGNVESSNYETKKYSKEIKTKLPYLYNNLNSTKNVRIINNKIANFNNAKIGGLEYFIDTIWIKEFKPAEFKKKMSEAKKQTDKAKRILKNFGFLDILICHQPPYRVLDKVKSNFAPNQWKGKHAGSKTILQYIKSKSPRYVFCGHIHEGKGRKKIGKTEVYNLGFCGYKLINL
ncbi:metallophosphoesterase [Candidatus Pacearchaeota archaeon]|nr:metallophosphoesterase [Candidatus Pacearchaeota archaeon]